MAKLSKSIVINAPVEKIFTFMNNPINLLEIWPGMVDIKDVQTLANGGTSFKYVYKMAGIRLEGTSEDTEYVPNQRTVSRSTGGIDAVATFEYEPDGQSTKLTVIDDYKIPIPVVGRLAEAVIVKMNEHEAETLLNNLKARMEAE